MKGDAQTLGAAEDDFGCPGDLEASVSKSRRSEMGDVLKGILTTAFALAVIAGAMVICASCMLGAS